MPSCRTAIPLELRGVVCVGKDENNNARYAFLRGTLTDSHFLCKVNLVHGQVGYDIDAACTAHGCTGHTDQPGLHTCAAQKIDRSQRLDFLEALCQ